MFSVLEAITCVLSIRETRYTVSVAATRITVYQESQMGTHEQSHTHQPIFLQQHLSPVVGDKCCEMKIIPQPIIAVEECARKHILDMSHNNNIQPIPPLSVLYMNSNITGTSLHGFIKSAYLCRKKWLSPNLATLLCNVLRWGGFV